MSIWCSGVHEGEELMYIAVRVPEREDGVSIACRGSDAIPDSIIGSLTIDIL